MSSFLVINIRIFRFRGEDSEKEPAGAGGRYDLFRVPVTGRTTVLDALECSRVCPAGVYPARHIMELRKSLRSERKR